MEAEKGGRVCVGVWRGRASRGEGEESVPGPSSWQMLANSEWSSAAPQSLWQKKYGNERRRGFNLENAFVVRYPLSSPTPQPTSNPRRQTVKQVACSISIHPESLLYLRSWPEPQHLPYPSYTSDLLSARWGPTIQKYTQAYSSAGREHNSAGATYSPHWQAA